MKRAILIVALILAACAEVPQETPETKSAAIVKGGGGILPVQPPGVGPIDDPLVECGAELSVCRQQCSGFCPVLGTYWCYICNSQCSQEYTDCFNSSVRPRL